MRLKLQLPAKAGRFHIFECEAVRLVTLPDEEFQDFLNGPHQDGRWAAEPFYADEHGRRIYQGVLVLGEGHKDGVFAYDGGKHFAYLPGARAVVDSILEQAVEKIIREGAENTNEGSWCYYFSELYEQMGLVIEDGNGFDTMLLEKLEQRPEAADVTLTDECFDVCYYLDYCKNLAPEQPAPSLSAERKEEIISGTLWQSISMTAASTISFITHWKSATMKLDASASLCMMNMWTSRSKHLRCSLTFSQNQGSW